MKILGIMQVALSLRVMKTLVGMMKMNQRKLSNEEQISGVLI